MIFFAIVLLLSESLLIQAFVPGVRRLGSFQRLHCEVSAEDAAEAPTEPVSHSVFVGNIPFTLGEDELVDMVNERAGTSYSSIRLVIDRRTNRSRGFAYVNYDEKEEAESAVEALSGMSLEGRDVRVELSQPGEKRDRKSRNNADGDRSIFIGNLDFSVGEEDLQSLCEEALGEGNVINVRLARDRESGRPRGFGHVVLENIELVDRAIEALNGADLAGRAIRVDKAQRKEKREPGHSIYLGNLAWDVTDDLVKEMIDDVLGEGLYDTVRLVTDRDTGRHRGFGYIDFKTEDAANRAIVELGGLEVLGRQLRADLARPRDGPRGPRRDRFGSDAGFRGGGGGGGGGGGDDDMF